MNLFKATQEFEIWLAKRLPVVRQDLVLKHTLMAEAPFPFFRATFYRWLQQWPGLCGEAAKAPAVLAVGDLHIENFGTWRDEEGRLIWGVNDLDEAWPAPYTINLVRLATSAYLAICRAFERQPTRSRRSHRRRLPRRDRGWRKGVCPRGTPPMVAFAGNQQTSRSGAVLGENGAKLAIPREAAE
jgi:hypothetical protein